MKNVGVRTFLYWAVVPMIGLLVGLKPNNAQAIPSFARQTGLECTACHVGGYGPQLTSYGRAFKMNGYVWGDMGNLLTNFSAVAWGDYEQTQKKFDQKTDGGATGPVTSYRSNNNLEEDLAILYYGGKLTDTIGTMSGVSYADSTRKFAWDWSELRFADSATVGGNSLVYGSFINNNPSLQDVWQTTPAWSFPYVGSFTTPSPIYFPVQQPYMNTLSTRVAGMGAYGLWKDLLYVELSGYKSLPTDTLVRLGQMPNGPASLTNFLRPDTIKGLAPYWRVALQQESGPHYFSFGSFGMDTHRYPNSNQNFGADEFLDAALDATYQGTFDDGKHIVSFYASALREHQTYEAGVANGNASNLHDRLDVLKANLSYFYRNTYGVTLGRFVNYGNRDPNLYGFAQQNPRPDDAGWTAQLDYIPFGTEGSFAYPHVNVRLFLQYTAYDKYQGASHAYNLGNSFGSPVRNAADNNALVSGLSVAF